jgi:hypothetical protein
LTATCAFTRAVADGFRVDPPFFEFAMAFVIELR